jgi:hypothetical protein
MQINELWQFPVKGLGGSMAEQISLTAGGYFPNDRRFAISTGTEKPATAAPGTWFKKAYFLQLMTHDALADYHAAFDESGPSARLSISHRDGGGFSIDPDSPADCARLEAFFAAAFAGQLAGTPRLMQMRDQAYSDQSTPLISIAGTASLDAFAAATDTKADNRRFRINIILADIDAFGESALIGKRIGCGDVIIDITAPVGRCIAINLDPETSIRGPDHLAFMRRHFGHSSLGVFGTVVRGGVIGLKDRFRLIP